jgi:hypothetical protein
VEECRVAGEFLLHGGGCGDDVVVVNGGADVGREEVPEGDRVLLRLGCVAGVVGVVDEFLLDVGDDFFDGGHFGGGWENIFYWFVKKYFNFLGFWKIEMLVVVVVVELRQT